MFLFDKLTSVPSFESLVQKSFNSVLIGLKVRKRPQLSSLHHKVIITVVFCWVSSSIHSAASPAANPQATVRYANL